MEERKFLQQRLEWKDPQVLGGATEHLRWRDPRGAGQAQVLGGVTRAGQAKPDFMLYCDSQDGKSRRNMLAEAVARLHLEQELVEAPAGGCYRVACVLMHSPTVSLAEAEADVNQGLRFSLDDIAEVLLFHTTSRGRSMYTSHDDPLHRMFGGPTLEGSVPRWKGANPRDGAAGWPRAGLLD